MTSLDEHAAPVPWPTLAVEALDDELAVYDESTGLVHRLNPTAAVVWRLLDGSTTLAEISDAIAPAARMPAPVVVADVVALARDLARAGLLAGDVDQAAVEPPGP